MKIRIENGMTIISTGDPHGGQKNKYNQLGISLYYSSSGTVKYRAEITVSKRKYYLGLRDTLEEASALRQEADKQVESGTFAEWFRDLKENTIYNQHGSKGIGTKKMAKGRIAYIAKLTYKNKTHQLCTKDTLEEAVAVRQEAEKQLKNGTFLEWFNEYKQNK